MKTWCDLIGSVIYLQCFILTLKPCVTISDDSLWSATAYSWSYAEIFHSIQITHWSPFTPCNIAFSFLYTDVFGLCLISGRTGRDFLLYPWVFIQIKIIIIIILKKASLWSCYCLRLVGLVPLELHNIYQYSQYVRLIQKLQELILSIHRRNHCIIMCCTLENVGHYNI